MPSKGETSRGTLTPAVSMETISFERDMRPRKKQGQKQRDRQQNDEHLRDLGPVKFQDEEQRRARVEDGGAVIADVKNEPDGEKAEDAIDVGLEKIPDDVAVEQSHKVVAFCSCRLALKLAAGMIALKDSLGSDFVERVRAIFAPDGLLAKARNFEYRPQQQEMAAAVARTLEEERHLVVEAGTGVGKSLAYLVPAILFAHEKKKKAIISTHTINLQEQLMHKDIPIVKKILPIEFEAALMKGRQNYICPRRLQRAVQSANDLFNTTEQADLARLADWARTTIDGTLSDLPVEPDPKVWTQVCSEAHLCTAKTCGQNPRCFSNKHGGGCSRPTWW